MTTLYIVGDDVNSMSIFEDAEDAKEQARSEDENVIHVFDFGTLTHSVEGEPTFDLSDHEGSTFVVGSYGSPSSLAYVGDDADTAKSVAGDNGEDTIYVFVDGDFSTTVEATLDWDL